MNIENFRKFYNGKKVFVTGHTGFKGSWLVSFLSLLGARVVGYALPARELSLFNICEIGKSIESVEGDIRDVDSLKQAIEKSGADVLFHLAAQAIVLDSYSDPRYTFEVNAMGTVNVLEVLRHTEAIKTAVIITSDKCYENKEWVWAYRESDQLGGHEPYSASKAMAEIAISSYYRSFLKRAGVGVASTRAGNVIGGGDFSPHRIVPDIVRSIQSGEEVVLRSPFAIRPWQHVLNVVYGYMLLASKLHEEKELYSSSYNFSLDDNSNDHTVQYVTEKFTSTIGRGRYRIDEKAKKEYECTNLRLDSSYARRKLGWTSPIGTDESIRFAADWYGEYIRGASNQYMRKKTEEQIETFISCI
ncbi:CDP-glucose 4,6-dehydratase [Candidatus Hydrogenosomobacter endosymbioticus]|uniref:CDP-glucose 4,6-dehydratase n=1 Tax=Candidatus Hydrogenosomobacter endosymbioticus TaxID=2558174 RepID=A0ABN6L2W2_9PROT|nr:CDP-glucose 4,6-dehydratase [Candidatus Hydrogenosomobacter endosymbioticus]BDB96220.1 CDP-glucose 4,6-dehydratase [Candidatus Hydrogenosomobacter endosymbioticus]